nr:hypothetical protein [Candidatus Njordarchaeum guaymaensis]
MNGDWGETLLTKALRMVELFRLDRILFTFFNLVPAHSFADYFRGFERNEIVVRLFGDRTEEVLRGLKVQFSQVGGYMGVNPSNGHLMVNPDYLRSGERVDIHLDVIHELVHVRQWMDGKSLFGGGYRYVERPTEVEAYRYAVEEARRLGLSDERICGYLKTEWMSDADLRQLVKT